MKHYVRLAGLVVAENFAFPDDVDVQERFHPSIRIVEVSSAQTIGWVYDETLNTFSPAPPPVPSKDELIAYAAARRYAVETGGVTIGSMSVATDRESQAMLNAAFNIAQGNADFSTMWKGSDGVFTLVTASQIIALAHAVGGFVANCFAAEAAAVTKIKTGDYTTTAQVDAAIVVPSPS